MKRSLIIGSFLFIFLVGFIYYLDAESQPDSASVVYKLSSDEIAKLQEGDLILRRGYGLLSTLIMKMMDEHYQVTHLGVLIKEHGQFYVIHSLSSSVSEVDGIQKQRLDSFVNNSYPSTLLISRLKNITPQQISRVKDRLRYYLQQQVPFDHYFDAQDTTAYYCSELVWKIYEKDLNYLKVAPNLSDDDKYNSLKMFYNPDYFESIVNHQK